jgi:hypothetical protein
MDKFKKNIGFSLKIWFYENFRQEPILMFYIRFEYDHIFRQPQAVTNVLIIFVLSLFS